MALIARDIELMRVRLTQGSEYATGLRDAEWINQTWKDPDALHLALFTMLNQGGALLKSHPAQGFDFYHDLIHRHRESESPAFLSYDRLKGWQRLGFADLHSLSGRLVAHWSRQGMEAGKSICLLFPMGPELVIALAAALRLGLIISILPPLGPRYVRRRLWNLKPDFVVAAPMHAKLLELTLPKESTSLLGLPSEAPPGNCFGSFTYPKETPVFNLFSPLHDPPDQPVEVMSEVIYCGLMRDMLVGWMLRRGQNMAVPGVDYLQFQPTLLMTTLLNGATFVHLEIDDIRSDVNLLGVVPIHTLGVTGELRDILGFSNVRPLGSLVHWFRFLQEPDAWQHWQRFITKQKLANHPTSNIMYDSTVGGTLLLSPWQRLIHYPMVPPPGLAFELKAPESSDQPSPNFGGVYVPAPQKEGWMVLIGGEDGYLYAGSLTPRRLGQVYPSEEVAEVVEELPFVHGAAVVPVSAADGTNHFLFILIVLTGSESRDAAREAEGSRSVAIEEALRLQLSPEFLPDSIELFPHHARKKEGLTDRRWILDQFRSGLLHSKMGQSIFHSLNALRKASKDSALGRLASARQQKDA